MILDAIIALFAPLFGLLAEGVTLTVVPFVNLLAAGIEIVVGVFVKGFSLGRIERKKRETPSTASTVGGIVTLLIIVGLVAWLVIAPTLMNRKVTLVAEEGHSLPFAALIIHTGHGDQHKRTDNSGNIPIPRFGTPSITINDPRYVEQTWENSEIKSELVVKRAILGSSLDSLANKLLKPEQK